MAHENLGFVVGQYGGLAERLSNIEGDMYVLYRKLGQNPSPNKGITAIETSLQETGLQGGVAYFTARSRRNGQEPIGVSVLGTGDKYDDRLRVGLYFPHADEKKLGESGINEKLKAAHGQVTAINKRKRTGEFEFDAELELVTRLKMAAWRERGLLELPTKTDHRSNATHEDEEWMKERNGEFLEVYANALVHAVAKVFENGVLPSQLTNRKTPIAEAVRHLLTINVDAFVNTDHGHLVEHLVERDDGRCSMPISRQMYLASQNGKSLKPEEIPVCNRNLYNYLPLIGHSRHKIKIDQIGQKEANHIFPRGGGMSALLKALWNGIIPLDLCRDPEKLLVVLSKMNIPMLSTLNGIDLIKHRSELFVFCAVTADDVDRAVNSQFNLVLADEDHHHDWYHPDEKIIVGVYKFLQAINTAGLIPPDSSSSKFSGWVKEHVKLILANDSFGQPGYAEYDLQYSLLRSARMMVGTVMGVPYWQNINTPQMLALSRHRTRRYINEKVAGEEERLHGLMDQLAGERGVDMHNIKPILELQEELSGIREAIVAEMGIKRSTERATKLLQRFGIEFNNWAK